MAKIRKGERLADQKAKVIEENFLEENPQGLPDKAGLVVTNKMPEYRRVRFLNGKDPGVPLEFHYLSKTHPLKHYCLWHGLVHELPVEVIEHLETCAEPFYEHCKNEGGFADTRIKGYNYLYTFRDERKAA